MVGFFKRGLVHFSERLALAHQVLVPERPALLVFAFHALFADAQALREPLLDPQQRITVAMLDQLVADFLTHGYVFVTPADVLRGLDPAGRYALLTFDDGYCNNRLALPVLRRYGVPATFFIASHYVLSGQAFWWDVVYRARQRQPLPPAAQAAEHRLLKQLPYPDIDAYLLAHFGPDALRPLGDHDRPFTPAELAAFAQEPEVTLGNHTAHHAILPNYPPATMVEELAACQRDLAGLSGTRPLAVAYPNGNVTPAVVAAAVQAGLQLGVTVEPGKNYLPLVGSPPDLLQLRRFMLWGTRSVARQCALFRADFHLREQVSKRLRR